MRVVLAEDLFLLRDGLIRLLEAYDFEVVAAVDNGPELARALIDLRPDVSIVDVRLPPSFTDEGLQAALQARLQLLMRRNTYDPATATITIDADRAAAMATVADHYIGLFGNDPASRELREAYAMKEGTVLDADNRTALTAFIWWSSWSAVTDRPGKHISYTNNWPHDSLVGNTPPSHLLLWTVFSFLFLIAGIALLGWHHARQREEAPPALPASDPLAAR